MNTSENRKRFARTHGYLLNTPQHLKGRIRRNSFFKTNKTVRNINMNNKRNYNYRTRKNRNYTSRIEHMTNKF